MHDLFAFDYAYSVITIYTSIARACVWCLCAGADDLTEGVALRPHCSKARIARAAAGCTCGRHAVHALHRGMLSLECLSSSARRVRLRQVRDYAGTKSYASCHAIFEHASGTWSRGCGSATPPVAPLPPPRPPWQLQMQPSCVPMTALPQISCPCQRRLPSRLAYGPVHSRATQRARPRRKPTRARAVRPQLAAHVLLPAPQISQTD